jgi:hypothetical protein
MPNVSQWIHLRLFLVAEIDYQLKSPLSRDGQALPVAGLCVKSDHGVVCEDSRQHKTYHDFSILQLALYLQGGILGTCDER